LAGYQLRQREVYQRLKDKLWTDRSTYETHWRDLADFVAPHRLRLQTSDRNRGEKKGKDILDNTAGLTLRTLASGLHAGMSSPARPWFKLSTPDPKLMESGAVKAWLYDSEQRMSAVFTLSNLYNALPELYGDVGLFSVGAMAVLEDDEDLFRCFVFPVGSFALGLDKRRRVCTFVLEDQYTVRQLVTEFGQLGPTGEIQNPENFSQRVLDAWKAEKYEESIDICWVVMPNDKADPSKLGAKYLPFTSCFFELARNEHAGVLRESGFRTFPIMAPRWAVTSNDSYGRHSPGMMLLGDAKQLQGMTRKFNQWLAKKVDPPLLAPSTLKNQPTSLVAGAITYEPPGQSGPQTKPLHEVSGEGMQFFLNEIEVVRNRIRRAGYEDMFLMFQSNPYGAQPPTAEEVRERHAEKLLELGPTLERMNDELLDPLIDRVFDIMGENGLLPDPPAELENVQLRVEFTSILAEAQKLTRVHGLDRFLASVAPLVDIFPEVTDKVDGLAVVGAYGDSLSVPPSLMRTDEEARARGQARAQAQADQAQAEQAAKIGTAVKNAGATPMNGDTALTRMLETVGVQ
jgi:hypothetical protein